MVRLITQKCINISSHNVLTFINKMSIHLLVYVNTFLYLCKCKEVIDTLRQGHSVRARGQQQIVPRGT